MKYFNSKIIFFIILLLIALLNLGNSSFSFSFMMPHAQHNIVGALISTYIEILFVDQNNNRIKDETLLDIERLKDGHYVCVPKNNITKGIRCVGNLYFLPTAEVNKIGHIIFIAKTDDTDGKTHKIILKKDIEK